MVGRSTVDFEVMVQWITALRLVHWPGPVFLMPEIYAAGHWIGVVPLRNLCTYRALQDPTWDYLLWIDADHKVHHNLFGRVREHMRERRAIVGGLYYARTWPFEVQAFGDRAAGGVRFVSPVELVPALQRNESRLMQVAGVGTGCMLIRRDVLERMAGIRGPLSIWRADAVDPAEQLRQVEAGEQISGVMTEDILFCLDAADHLGVKTWLDLDPRMETGHVGTETRDRNHYLAAHQVVARTPEEMEQIRVGLRKRGYDLVTEQGDVVG
jgi:hypothetical protein